MSRHSFLPPDKFAVTRGLRGMCIVAADAEAACDRLAWDLFSYAHRRVTETTRFHLAFSGGKTPEQLFRLLIIDPRYRSLPWAATHVWLVDDRCVPPDDDRSNFKMIREYILDHVTIAASHIHPMPVQEADGDVRYEHDLRTALNHPGTDDRLDFILLGMGADGHTASLFPRTPALRQKHHWVVFNDGPTVAEPRPRMTVTFPVINASRRIAVLVSGESKHATLQHVAVARDDVERFPITGVEPSYVDGQLTWYLDEAAAAGPSARPRSDIAQLEADDFDAKA